MLTGLEKRTNSQGGWLSGVRGGSSEEKLQSFFLALLRRGQFEGKEDDESSCGSVGLRFLRIPHEGPWISGERSGLDVELGVISLKLWVGNRSLHQ